MISRLKKDILSNLLPKKRHIINIDIKDNTLSQRLRFLINFVSSLHLFFCINYLIYSDSLQSIKSYGSVSISNKKRGINELLTESSSITNTSNISNIETNQNMNPTNELGQLLIN